MENAHNTPDTEGESTLGTIAIITGLILFLWSIFSIFFGIIENRTQRFSIRFFAFCTVAFAEIQAIFTLYDHVLAPLPGGACRWPEYPHNFIYFGIFYAILYILAMLDTWGRNRRSRV